MYSEPHASYNSSLHSTDTQDTNYHIQIKEKNSAAFKNIAKEASFHVKTNTCECSQVLHHSEIHITQRLSHTNCIKVSSQFLECLINSKSNTIILKAQDYRKDFRLLKK